MDGRLVNGAILMAIAGLWLASGTQREKPVVASPRNDLARLEAKARTSEDPRDLRDLAQAYLDSDAPGQAIAAIEHAPRACRADGDVEHTYARALLNQGRATDALEAERRVLARCEAVGCATWLFASANHRAGVMGKLVELGIDDVLAHPEASAVAYAAVTREARLSVQ